MRTSLKESPSCQTSCSKESSKTNARPSCQPRVSSTTRILTPSGMTSPKWERRRQLVGPQWGHTWTPGCITENFTWTRVSWSKVTSSRMETNNGLTCPLRQPATSGYFSTIAHVLGALAQFLGFFFPWTNSVNCFQSPDSRRSSSSRTNDPVLGSNWASPSSRIVSQFASRS